jgi:hypothetical protein
MNFLRDGGNRLKRSCGKRMWDEGQVDGDTGYTGIVSKGMLDEGQMDEGTGYTYRNCEKGNAG